MSVRSPGVGVALIGVVVLVALGAGTVFGVGPLANRVPADKVTDPKEMLARSLQATLDASSVHLEGVVAGTLPGRFIDSADAAVSLDGTRLDADVRPHDGKTRAHVESPGLGLALDTVTVWDGALVPERVRPMAAGVARGRVGRSPASTSTR